MFRDSWGLIVTANGDGGDSLRRENCFWLAHYLRGKMLLDQPHSRLIPQEVITLCEVRKEIEIEGVRLTEATGVVIRHPDPTQWWSDPKNTSRDQTLGMFILGQLYDREFLNRLIETHRKRWWFCSNGTDNLWFTSVIHRARGGVFNVLLYVTDWFFLFDFFSAIGMFPTYDDGKKKWTFYDPDDTGKFWNLSLAMCQPGHDTVVRKLMRWIFANFSRQNNGTVAFKETHPVAAALLWESRDDTPELGQIWIPLIYQYFPRWSRS